MSSSSSSCDAPGNLICGGGSKSTWRAGAAGVLEVSVRDHTSFGRVEAIFGESKGVSIGEEVFVATDAGNDRVLLPVYASGEWSVLMGTKEIGWGIAIEDGVLKDSGKHPLTTEQVVSAVMRPTQPECMSVLQSFDDYYTVDECDGCAVAGGGGSSSGALALFVAIAVARAAAFRRSGRAGRRATARASSAGSRPAADRSR